MVGTMRLTAGCAEQSLPPPQPRVRHVRHDAAAKASYFTEVVKTVLCLITLITASLALAQSEDDEKHKKEVAKDVELGKEIASEIEESFKLVEDEAVLELVQKVGDAIAEIAQAHHIPATWGDKRHSVFEYTFKVIDNPDVNAFSILGGFIYINSGLLDYVESEDELAAVLAHEVAHAANRHLATLLREQSKVKNWTLPIIIAALLGGSNEVVNIVYTSELLTLALTNSWSQKAESDADRTGFFYLSKSSYHPAALLTFMERLAFKERNSPRIDWGIQRTHPPSKERLQALTKLLKENDIPIARSKVTTSFRVTSVKEEDRVVLRFGNEELFTLLGNDAELRAEQMVSRLNEFFDSVPQLFHIRSAGNRLFWKFDVLIEFQEDDAGPDGSPEALAAEALAAVKSAIYRLGFRTGGERCKAIHRLCSPCET